jgi:hypothetical protein
VPQSFVNFKPALGGGDDFFVATEEEGGVGCAVRGDAIACRGHGRL